MSQINGTCNGQGDQASSSSNSTLDATIDEVIESVVNEFNNELGDSMVAASRVKPWTVVEREKLLTGLKLHGPHDVSRIQKLVGTRSIREVLLFLREMKIRAETEIECKSQVKQTPIQKWIEIIDTLLDDHPDYTSALYQVFLQLAAKYREDPNRNRFMYVGYHGEREEVEYSRIFAHFACLVKGCALNQLSPMESFILIELLRRITSLSKSLNSTAAENYFRSIAKAFQEGQLTVLDSTLSMFSEEDELGEDEFAFFDRSFNPLNIPPEIIDPTQNHNMQS